MIDLKIPKLILMTRAVRLTCNQDNSGCGPEDQWSLTVDGQTPESKMASFALAIFDQFFVRDIEEFSTACNGLHGVVCSL